jgi:hypothetical protein
MWSTCSVYDSDLVHSIHPLDDADRKGEGSRGDPLVARSKINPDASIELGPDEIGRPRDDDGGTSSVVKCGDGQVSGVEKCDTAIAADQAGACPKDCPALAECVPRILNGTGCQTECVLRQLTCQSGDHCCPGNCTKDNDLDCSARCGDGIVQTTSGETCEPDTDKPCLTSASACDDNDACTIDRLTGSAANCNVACTHERIRTPGPDDGCCPEGANAKTDPNCQPRCGNGVKEAGEDCDGSDDCDPNCKFINSDDRNRCMAQAQNDCERCACMQCTATELACSAGMNPNDNMLCANIIRCSSRNKCIGTPCYCGESPGCAVPIGACRAEIEAAGGNALQVAQQVGDPNTLVGRSYAADQCRVMKCNTECRK